MLKVFVLACVLAVVLTAPAPQLPQVPGLEAWLAAQAVHAEHEGQVRAAAALFPPNPSPGVVSNAGAIGASGIVGSSGNIGQTLAERNLSRITAVVAVLFAATTLSLFWFLD